MPSLPGFAFLTLFLSFATFALAQAEESIRFVEPFPDGSRHHVWMRVVLNGTMTPPPAKGKAPAVVEIDGGSTVEYDEVILASEKGRPVKTFRLYDRLDFKRILAKQSQELSLRPGVRRLVIVRKGHTEVPFSPDAALTWGEIDAVRTDVFLPALTGLFPTKAVRVGEKWIAAESAVQELTDLDEIKEGQLQCSLVAIETIATRRLARVNFSGKIQGIGEDGPVSHNLNGHFFYDLAASSLAELNLNGVATLLSPDKTEMGKIEGRLSLVRSPVRRPENLGKTTLDKLKLEPDNSNTQMLYENAELGVRFLHSRRWRVTQVMGAQVGLDTREGNSVLITVDPSEKVPTAAEFQTESLGWLGKQKANVLHTYTPRRLRERPTLDAFAFEAELKDQKIWLDYYVTRQNGGGATIAARLLPTDLSALRREIDRIARSVEILKKITIDR
jgi:hypothetical protein